MENRKTIQGGRGRYLNFWLNFLHSTLVSERTTFYDEGVNFTYLVNAKSMSFVLSTVPILAFIEYNSFIAIKINI